MAEYYRKPEPLPHPPPQPDGHVEPRPEGVPEHAHEGTDVNVRALVYTAVGFIIFAVVTLAFLFWLHRLSERMSAQAHTGVQSAVRQAQPVPQEPRLQGIAAPVGPRRLDKDGKEIPRPDYHENTPAEDMDEARRKNTIALDYYLPPGPDGTGGRIPIARAMELAMERQIFKTGTPPATRPAAGEGAAQGEQQRPQPAEAEPGAQPSGGVGGTESQQR